MSESAASAPWLGRATLLPLIVAVSLFCASNADAACPNEQLRQEQVSTFLPACMALEMVSPPAKGSQPAIIPMISADGARVLFYSRAPLGETQGINNPLGDPYLAIRGAAGWSIEATAPPGKFGALMAGGVFDGSAITPGLDRWLTISFTETQALNGLVGLYEGGREGRWVELMPPLEPANSSSLKGAAVDARLAGVSVDFSHALFTSGALNAYYLSGDPIPDGPGAQRNTYVLDGQGILALLARDSMGEVWGNSCGAWLGGGWIAAPPTDRRGGRTQGAVSEEGDVIYFSTRPGQPSAESTCDTGNPVRVLKREETGSGPQITELASGPGGDDLFQAASQDSSRVYFTSPRNLAASDLDAASEECGPAVGASQGCDLYLFESTPDGDHLIQVSAGEPDSPSPGQGADVLSGITSVSTDGSHAYFVAQGVLTTEPNPEGAVAQGGDLNLYVYQRTEEHPDGHTAFVGALDETCHEDEVFSDCTTLFGWIGSAVSKSQWEISFGTQATAVPLKGEHGGDGHILVFASLAPLTSDDADGLHRDVFRYDSAAGTLTCVSCTPAAGALDVTVRASANVVQTQYAERERRASEDGNSILFATDEPLVPDDVDGRENPYLWRAGEGLTRLPGVQVGEGRPGGPGAVVAADGSEVAFESALPLLPSDGDLVEDIYLAKVGGGFPNLPPPPVCAGEDCQGPPRPQPLAVQPASKRFAGRGNLRPPGCKKARAHRKLSLCGKQSKGKKRRSSHRRGGNGK